jgi:hypothetical protein
VAASQSFTASAGFGKALYARDGSAGMCVGLNDLF